MRGAGDTVATVRDPRHAVFVVALSLAACGSDGSDIPDHCNPLGGQGCLLPWPSSAYLVADSKTATGRRVDLPIKAMPRNIDDVAIDPVWINRWDGFSPTGPMLVAFPTGVSQDSLPSWKSPDESLAADSPIVLLDMTTGQRAPFFAEVDQNTLQVEQRNLIIRPLARLAPGSHYVVAIRKGIKAADGSDLAPSPAFAAALEGRGYNHPRFSSTPWPDIFAALETAGVPKTDLVLAWDFHTASNEYLRSDLLTMRDAALPAIGEGGANLTFSATARPPRTGLLKSFAGTFKSPNFLTNGEADESKMVRDGSDKPQMMGMRDARFAALVPECVTTEALPRPTIVFGHGLFGSGEEYLDDKFVIDLAQRYCFVIVAGDFIGLTSRQLALAPLAVNDVNKGQAITEKLAQSVIDFIALESITRGPFRTSAEFKHEGAEVIDPARVFYVGGSLGGIMGNTFMAYDPNITKAVLAVPGGVWSLMFERSNAWHLLKGSAMGAYTDPEIYQLIVAFLGMGMEPYDPITTAEKVIKDPMPGVPQKEILIWYAIGDSLVTNIATEMIGRTLGLDLLGPAVKDVWGMPAKSGPLANAITVYDEHPSPMPSDFNIPPSKDNGTHSGVNRNPSALRQVEAFLLQGGIVQTCGGTTPAACDCATGACD
jgi:pimeloyl-ACP methyl ester carboxylesterase